MILLLGVCLLYVLFVLLLALVGFECVPFILFTTLENEEEEEGVVEFCFKFELLQSHRPKEF